ncbi:UNVERIFIED_CONTAM: hypothetical protein Sindi_2053100 [Sesamum indicum]
MAAVFSSSISAAFRMNPIYPKATPDSLQLQEVFVPSCAQIIVPFPKCRLKLYMVPFNRFSGRHGLRSFAVDSLLRVAGKHPETDVSSGVLGPNNCQRSSELEGQLQELFDEVKTMIKLGKKDDAVDLLQANYEAVKEQVESGARGIEEAAILDVIALGYMALGDLRTVRSLMDVLHEIVNELKDEELLLDSILMHMGSINAKLEKFELSISFYRRSLQIMETKYGSKSSFLSTPLLGMAKVLETNGRATEAIETYQRVIKILESSRGGESEELILPLCSMGNLLMHERKTLDAEYTFNRVVNIYRRSYGEKDERVGMAMSSLAQVKCAKGEVNEAIDLYKRAIQILKDSKHMAVDDKVLEKMRIDLAELLHLVGRNILKSMLDKRPEDQSYTKHDVIAQLCHAKRLAEKLYPSSRMVELNGGHLVSHERTEEVNKALSELIKASDSMTSLCEWTNLSNKSCGCKYTSRISLLRSKSSFFIVGSIEKLHIFLAYFFGLFVLAFENIRRGVQRLKPVRFVGISCVFLDPKMYRKLGQRPINKMIIESTMAFQFKNTAWNDYENEKVWMQPELLLARPRNLALAATKPCFQLHLE